MCSDVRVARYNGRGDENVQHRGGPERIRASRTSKDAQNAQTAQTEQKS